MGRMIKMPLFEAEKLECSNSGNSRRSMVFVSLPRLRDTPSPARQPKSVMSLGGLFWSGQHT